MHDLVYPTTRRPAAFASAALALGPSLCSSTGGGHRGWRLDVVASCGALGGSMHSGAGHALAYRAVVYQLWPRSSGHRYMGNANCVRAQCGASATRGRHLCPGTAGAWAAAGQLKSACPTPFTWSAQQL